MKEKRNIDELFQSRLGNHEATPSPEVWQRIEAQLNKKKDRKVIPLWWKLGGVAALLAILLLVGNGLFTTDTTNPLVVEDPDGTQPVETEITPNKDASNPITDTRVVDGERTTKGVDSQRFPETSNENRSNGTGIASETDATPVSNKSNNQQIEQQETYIQQSKTTKTAVANTEKPAVQKESQIGPPPNKGIPNPVSDTKDTGVAGVIPNKQTPDKPEEVTPNNPSDIVPSEIGQKEAIASEAIAEKENPEEETNKETPKKKSIFDAIAENEKEAVATVEEKKSGGWEVTPNVGPVYYNSINGGSSIDPSFADNTQTGEVNFSYGVQVAYNLNDRLSVRTGVNNVNVGYTTGGIEIASGPLAFGLKSVAYDNPNRDVLTVFDRGTVPEMNTDPDNPYAQLNLKSTSGNAELRQSITYYEIPLEAKYSLLNKRIGINMIGGFSTLVLGDSEISVNDTNFRNVLGESNNLNELSFSGNIGLGFDYKISKRFKFNIEPMFKYQFNPYSDSSVDFQPYYFGVYSGLSFKF